MGIGGIRVPAEPQTLRQRLTITNSDGAYASGEASRHSTSPLWNHLWDSIGRQPRIGWDSFHRVNIAGKRALHSSQLAEAFLTLTKDLEAVFGGGQGRMLDRQVSQFMDQPLLTTMVPAGTRELGYLAGVPARFWPSGRATTWTQSSAAAMPRRAEAQGQQHGGSTLASSWPAQNS